MWKITYVLITCLFVASCVAVNENTYTFIRFPMLVRGEIAGIGNRIKVVGFVDTSGINFYSLQGTHGNIGSEECVALVLQRSDKRKAKEYNGRKVWVTGSLITSNQINSMLPEGFGEINGRSWAGTDCRSEYVIYVKEMQIVPK